MSVVTDAFLNQAALPPKQQQSPMSGNPMQSVQQQQQQGYCPVAVSQMKQMVRDL